MGSSVGAFKLLLITAYNTELFAFFRNSSKSQQEMLLELTWAIWPELPAYGRKAAQFVDLLGYFSLKTPQTEKKVCLCNLWNVS